MDSFTGYFQKFIKPTVQGILKCRGYGDVQGYMISKALSWHQVPDVQNDLGCFEKWNLCFPQTGSGLWVAPGAGGFCAPRIREAPGNPEQVRGERLTPPGVALAV